ncbi:hypothetical protein EON81_10650 [bacterium]|nr:MAG: hypothetical protein EON81_10650 [bacterium]
MTAHLLYALGTLLAWIGAALLLLSLFAKEARGIRAGVGAGFLLVAAATPTFQTGFGIPLLWIVMPFAGWMAAVSLLMSGVVAVEDDGQNRDRHPNSGGGPSRLKPPHPGHQQRHGGHPSGERHHDP